ncbi:MAG TPA: pyridoxamine 5'-phosphate oxidase family protein [Candidatus Eisenbergiella merdipullorum]|uniref:Pyridoxamine 5'-phosphate oxidase family protein n=1 Tax=Candidatus Eisenbergiella merdipullorum TaxID=2838553 RepID=A0A9D2L1L9_9FIRM|nr:pyridoxamine 5'-phosphate oxidase family protein [Candidatus Eisenbergiella merdipullorum]
MEKDFTGENFRPMRRGKQALSAKECEAVLKRGTSGVLALLGDGGYPYAVPLSYVYDAGRIFFHCAKAGHKIDAIRNQEKASFCVIDQDRVVPEKYTTFFRSVIVFGRVRILEEEGEIHDAIEKLAVRYAPEESRESREAEIDRFRASLCMLELTVEHMTGKECIELVKEKERSVS